MTAVSASIAGRRRIAGAEIERPLARPRPASRRGSREERPMADTSFDLVVVGGGPGGYVAAIRAAQLEHEDGAGRARASGRHLPQLGLHPDQGAAALGRGLSPDAARRRLRLRAPSNVDASTSPRWSSARASVAQPAQPCGVEAPAEEEQGHGVRRPRRA